MSPVLAPAAVHALLDRLHTESKIQEDSWSAKLFYFSRITRYYFGYGVWDQSLDSYVRDKFVALERDKCEIMYLLARATNALNIVEVGTSFGVSTIYLALAVGQNIARTGGGATGKVIGTEHEPTKAARAREHWKQCGGQVEPYIELREGDLRETLKVEEGMPQTIDLVLLDIWTPMALPALEILKPRLRSGSLILVDNTTSSRVLYKDLLDYVKDETNGFKSTTIPYAGGLEAIVYLPGEGGDATNSPQN